MQKLALVVTLATSLDAFAQSVQQIPIRLPQGLSGRLTTVAVSPSGTGVIADTEGGGLYRSNDGAA